MLNQGRKYNCKKVSPTQTTTLLDHLTETSFNFTRFAWQRRILRGNIYIGDVQTLNPNTSIDASSPNIVYHRVPWIEPVLSHPLDILYKDTDFFVINKPSGLPTMPSQTFHEFTALHILRQGTKEIQTSNISPAQPVHRLGVGTSGILVVATSSSARTNLSRAIRERRVTKVYRALVTGANIPDTLRISCPIGPVAFPIGGGTLYAACSEDVNQGVQRVVLQENGLPSTNNNKEMDRQAINQSTERSQAEAAQIQLLIDSGLVQSEKTKYPINQVAGAVPPANNANEKAAAENEERKEREETEETETMKQKKQTQQTQQTQQTKQVNKPSLSLVHVIRRDWKNNTAVVEVEIPTGRPHQIRIHMAYSGHPLVGDPLYMKGGLPNHALQYFPKRKKEDEDMDTDDEGNDDEEKHTADMKEMTLRVALPRDTGYILHAHRITLEHPTIDGKWLTIVAPPPDSLK